MCHSLVCHSKSFRGFKLLDAIHLIVQSLGRWLLTVLYSFWP